MVTLSIPTTPRAAPRHRLAPTFTAVSPASTQGKPPTRLPPLFPLVCVSLLLLSIPPLRSSFVSTAARPVNHIHVPSTTVTVQHIPPDHEPLPTLSLPRRDLQPIHTAFCPALLAAPFPHDRNCARSSANYTCTSGLHAGAPTFFGGHAQDFYVWTRHFRHLNRRGVYLDVATNDPVSMSNTFFFDTCVRWQGLCVEANPAYLEKIFRLRSCLLVPTCVASREGETVSFALDGQKGGVVGDTNRHPTGANVAAAQTVLNMRCVSLAALLKRGGVSVVDFLSLDVEGHELATLQGVNWDRVRINVVVVEVTGKTIDALELFLVGKGYVRHVPDYDERSKRTGLLGEDAVFVRGDVVWGEPV